MGNIIHRETKAIKVKSLLDSTAMKAGQIAKVYKDDFDGWHYTDDNGTTWRLFISSLRNENYFEILEQHIDWTVITYDEGNPYIAKTYPELQHLKKKYKGLMRKTGKVTYHISNKEVIS